MDTNKIQTNSVDSLIKLIVNLELEIERMAEKNRLLRRHLEKSYKENKILRSKIFNHI